MCKLVNLTQLHIEKNQFSYLPEIVCNLCNLKALNIANNLLESLPESIGNLSDSLVTIFLCENRLTSLPESIGNLSKLFELYLEGNQLTKLPDNISNLSNLHNIDLNRNPIIDLSILQTLPRLQYVEFLNVALPRRYWTKLSDWNPKWLLDEENVEIRRVLIQQIGYDRICQELDAIDLDTWREYTLLKIDADIDEEPMVLLKMTCPSTGHIHLLRVPPEMTSAEAAITWVNHGIHPDQFIIQT
jgi:leucine-rich repeat protein SHOC2